MKKDPPEAPSFDLFLQIAIGRGGGVELILRVRLSATRSSSCSCKTRNNFVCITKGHFADFVEEQWAVASSKQPACLSAARQ